MRFVCLLPTAFCLLLRGFLASTHGLADGPLSPRVRARALAVHREIAPVAYATVAADFDQPLNVEGYFAAQLAFDTIVAVDDLAQPGHFLLGQVAHPRVRIDACGREDFLTRGETDAKDIGQADLHTLVTRDVDASNTRHSTSSFILVAVYASGWSYR